MRLSQFCRNNRPQVVSVEAVISEFGYNRSEKRTVFLIDNEPLDYAEVVCRLHSGSLSSTMLPVSQVRGSTMLTTSSRFIRPPGGTPKFAIAQE